MPQEMLDHCKALNIPTSGNVVGKNSTTDFEGQPYVIFAHSHFHWCSKFCSVKQMGTVYTGALDWMDAKGQRYNGRLCVDGAPWHDHGCLVQHARLYGRRGSCRAAASVPRQACTRRQIRSGQGCVFEEELSAQPMGVGKI